MGTYRFNDDVHKKKQLPAGQRGIGCLLMLLLPPISYFAAIVLLKTTEIRNFFGRVNPALFGTPSIPKLLWKIKTIDPFLRKVSSWQNLEVNLLFGLVILLVLSGVIAVFYSIMDKAVNPSRYGPTDAPPSKRRPSKKSR